MKAQLYYLDKKTQKEEKTFDQLVRAAKFIARANDPSKYLGNKTVRFLLAYIVEMLNRSSNKEIHIDHELISSITDCGTDQNYNLLAQLADIFEFKYHRSIRFEGKKKLFGYIVKFTSDGEKRITNPELFYPIESPKIKQKSSVIRPKKFGHLAEKIRPSTIYKKDIQDIEFNSFSKKKELNFFNLTTCAREEVKSQTKQSADLLSFPDGAANHADQHKETEHQKEKIMQTYNWKDPARKLDLAISKNFDIATATMLTVDIDYHHCINTKKMQMYLKKPVILNEPTKNLLRQIIKDIYGHDIAIVCGTKLAKKDNVVKLSYSKEKFNHQSQEPPKIDDFSNKPLTQKVIMNLIEDKFDKSLINSWLNPIRVKIIEYENQIIFECSDFTAEQIINRFISSLMQSCKEFDLEIIFLARDRLDEIREIKITEQGKW